jgi:hypothetical protein
MRCSVCNFESEYLPRWKYNGKQNTSWSWEGGLTTLFHCPVCGEVLILEYVKKVKTVIRCDIVLKSQTEISKVIDY